MHVSYMYVTPVPNLRVKYVSYIGMTTIKHICGTHVTRMYYNLIVALYKIYSKDKILNHM